MGSSHESQNRRKRRNSDCISNYVDRVRICDTKSVASESIYSKASSQKSGWRQKSLSNIDLTSSADFHQPGAGAFRYRDFEAHDDLCIKNIKNNKNIEIQRDYEDIYNINPKAQGLKRDIIHEHNKANVNKRENEVCSLRRSKSLAVIREETYNDLSLPGGNKSRRSQLIPRAKLIDRNFFKDRFSFALDEGLNFSLDSATTLDQEKNSNNSINTNDKKHCSLDSHNHHYYYSWQCDRSDLDSIDSSIFKHSLHQSAFEKSNTLKTESTIIISRAEVHNTDDVKSENSNNSCCEQLTSQKEHNTVNTNNDDTESGITIIEIKDKKHQFDVGPSSVISYDSIYLSSESDKQTLLNETIESFDEIDLKIKDFEQIINELNIVSGENNEKAESIIDNLYSQVANKSKTEVSTVEPRINPDTLSKYTDYISKGTLERLTILTGFSESKCNSEKNEDKSITNSHNSSTEFQYSSLPDAGISKLLRDCELIDAKLRDDNISIQLIEPEPDYDSLSIDVNGNESNGKCEEKEIKENEKRSIESISLEENPKGEPSVELVRLSTKEVDTSIDSERKQFNNTTKIYLPEIGLELDYENSIVSFESDVDSESSTFCAQPIFNLVTISGRKVIVDELAAKAIQKDDDDDAEPIVDLKQSDKKTLSLSSYSANTKVIVKKINSFESNDKANTDKSDKIKSPECKQEFVDSSNSDKKQIHLEALPVPHYYNDQKSEENKSKIQSESDNNKEYKSTFCGDRRNSSNTSMPRPQLLNIVDSKNSISKHNIQQQHQNRPSNSPKESNIKDENDKKSLNPTEREFLHKVDSIRNYWSKMLDENEEIKSESNLKKQSKKFLTSKSSNDIPASIKTEDFQSFFPTVEIVELNGETQAAIVTQRKLNDVDFDHVRYKVMKSDIFQKNLLINNRKETQFDGLMQYLQDYSFQELLANNNVVIIEPVRTKIEKIYDKPNKAQSVACKITNGALLQRNGSNNLKKHFFYHPIRVNKELYEDEIPASGTVSNVRKMFEGSLRLSSTASTSSSKLSDESKISSKSSDNLRRKAIRYLTIDTSYDNISLSSGVSSADLSSPCECHESFNKDVKFIYASKENIDDDDLDDDDGEIVSQDVLEKIRECGSSVTYYGGQVLGKKMNSQLMTKAIMKEISNQKCSCQSRRHPVTGDKSVRKLSNDYAGIKFKLVKSNSCSSRLELAGTCSEKSNLNATEEMKNIIHGQKDSSAHITTADDVEAKDDPIIEQQEDTVKDMIYRLEGKANVPTKPRIIESRCIEKTSNGKHCDGVTINNQTLFEKTKNELIQISTLPTNDITSSNVTVNNHISVLNSVTSTEKHQRQNEENKPKIVRNKNVDLALATIAKRNDNKSSKTGDAKENLAQKASLQSIHPMRDESLDVPQEHTKFKASKWGNICKMESVEMVKNQDKINNSTHIKNHSQNAEFPLSASKSEAFEKPIKMVNWSTVGNLGKEYIANDRRLIETSKKYDEMEFEEFEVMEDDYDSLNSK